MSHGGAVEDDGAIPTFGVEVAGRSYWLRQGAYGVIPRRGRIAVVEGPKGLYLPGGGIEAGENAEAALVREINEECGQRAQVRGYLGQACEFTYSDAERRHFKKHGFFFLAAFETTESPLAAGSAWIDVERALAGLAPGSHRWAVQRCLDYLRDEDPGQPRG
jgi:8-oxo-dGTP diphosphatase